LAGIISVEKGWVTAVTISQRPEVSYNHSKIR